ncbi:hypothetical protein EUTSA_v10005168mg [Eutrema salsugineum]|uniref:Uncharacterized protein n=1 Tax=Eutrema salsugineum TaxID=72664 RepID=V4KTD9_EUTSA|nr:hypothetical protein EUTSA_v10005168mg [Eutrema salsugineum]
MDSLIFDTFNFFSSLSKANILFLSSQKLCQPTEIETSLLLRRKRRRQLLQIESRKTWVLCMSSRSDGALEIESNQPARSKTILRRRQILFLRTNFEGCIHLECLIRTNS